ncbi:MAG TPA: hypothetical protein VGX25_09475 [Actinophytocola sp.]|uniref:hypothetical protein n=1 Tax=Actinophytocola sp. TaxID=1872138 RepID=UPI002DDCCD7A|nr:hypothetical protein [Actinophytocola sp.]HEV2779618.1 hypothetical protein [Actinophytocola sp.]
MSLLGVAACSAGEQGQDNGEPAIGTIPTLLASVDLRLPVQDYLMTEQQAARFAKARVALIQQCMKRFGIDYVVPDLPSGYGPRSLTDRRYGVTDAELVRRYGYGLGERDPALRPKPVKPDIGPDGESALFGDGPTVVRGIGVPDGGCAGEADRGLDRTVPSGADPQLGNNLQFQSFEASKKDSRVRAVFTAWSSCMAESGYHYRDPLASVADPRFSGREVTQEQIDVAEADVRCKGKSNLIGIWFTVESAYQKREIDRNPAAFAACKEALAARARAAEAAAPSG